MSFKLSIFNNPDLTWSFDVFKLEQKLGDFYYSFDTNTFGWTKCPNYMYRVTLTVLDKEQKPIQGVLINSAETTDEKGIAKIYLRAGDNNITFDKDGKVAERKVYVSKAGRFTFAIDFDNPDAIITGRNALFRRMVILSGKCGDNAFFNLYNDGVLEISGTGDLYSYIKDQAPWYNYVVREVRIFDGITKIGPADCHILNARLREYITLGSYEQDGNDGNGKEPIEWLVLSQDDDKMLVVSKYCLDYLTYPDDWTSNIVWETCSLRSYLNSDFYTDSFTEDEQQQIIRSENQNKASEDYYSTVDGNDTDDNVFLLSIDEVQKYLPAMTATESSKRAYGTDYLYDILKGHQYYGNVKTGDPVNWALRADIDTERNAEGVGRPREMVVYDSQITCMITTGGMRDPDGPLSVVRPAMWVKNTVSKHRNSEHTETAESESDVSDENPDDEISDKNTGNNSDWSDMYYHLIVDNNYSIEADDEYNTKITVNSDIPLALHDFDMDGTPELIIGYIGARLGLEVFTILDGNVVYAGGIGGKASFYSDNESYHGIFRNDSWSETQVLAYTGLSDGKLDQHEVLSGKFNQTTKEFDYSVLDDTLYNVYLDCTTSDSDEISAYRQPKNELKLYYWRDIESDGWDSFVEYYGF